jgi:predicted outer membrane protein
VAVGMPPGLELRKVMLESRLQIHSDSQGLGSGSGGAVSTSRVSKERVMNSRWKALLAMSAGLLLIGAALAQDPAQRQREQPQQQPGAAAMQPGQPAARTAGSLDSHLAQCLTIDNQHEIAVAEIAKQRAKDNEVKQFADKLIQDHTQFLQQLARFTGRQPGMAGGQPGEVRTTERQPGQPGAAQPGAMTQMQGGEPNFLAIKQQVSQKALELTKKELEKKEGVEFDKCFVGDQIGAHLWVLATLEVFKDQQVSPDLRNVIDKGIQTTQEHLDHAKKLAENLERQGTHETAGRPSERRTE